MKNIAILFIIYFSLIRIVLAQDQCFKTDPFKEVFSETSNRENNNLVKDILLILDDSFTDTTWIYENDSVVLHAMAKVGSLPISNGIKIAFKKDEFIKQVCIEHLDNKVVFLLRRSIYSKVNVSLPNEDNPHWFLIYETDKGVPPQKPSD